MESVGTMISFRYFRIAPFSPTAYPVLESAKVRSKITALSGVGFSIHVSPLSEVKRNLKPDADHPSVFVLKSIANERPNKGSSSKLQFSPASVVLISPIQKNPSGSPESVMALSESKTNISNIWSGLTPTEDQFKPKSVVRQITPARSINPPQA